MRVFELYIEGGVEYMHAVSIPFIINLILVIFTIVQMVQKKTVNKNLMEAGKHLGGLALAVGVLGTTIGLFQGFGAIAASTEVIPFEVIMEGLKYVLITLLYGLIVFCLSQLAYIILKLVNRKSLAQ